MKKKFHKIISLTVFVLFMAATYMMLNSYAGGIVGVTKRTSSDGCFCHGFSASANVRVFLEGPASVQVNDTATFRLKMTGGPLVKGGTDIAAQRGNLILSPLETNLQLLTFNGVNELTHFPAKTPVNDTVTYIFRYVAPNTPNTKDTLYANGNSINGTGSSGGDQWNFAVNKIIDITPLTSITNTGSEVKGYSLNQNYPNPFNPVTKISFSVKGERSKVKLMIFDVTGRTVSELVNQELTEGNYEYTFDASNLSSGLYFYELQAGDFRDTRKMILSK